MVHNVKIALRFFTRIHMGVKGFEVRFNDRDYQVGDVLEFTVVSDKDPSVEIKFPTEQKPRYVVVYAHQGYGLERGFIILGLKEQFPYAPMGDMVKQEEPS